MVRRLVEQGLISRRSAPQCVEADVLSVQIDFTAHEPMQPVIGHWEVLAQQVSASPIIGAAHEDQSPGQRCIHIEGEARRESAAWWSPIVARDAARAVRVDVTCADGLQLHELFESMALPDLGLPQPIEGLDHVLKAGLARGRKHWYDAQRQAEPTDLPHG